MVWFTEWLQMMNRRHGKIVSFLLALFLLSALTLLLALVMVVIGAMMWYSPYGTMAILLVVLVYYLIRSNR
jgi:hypothetical protein